MLKQISDCCWYMSGDHETDRPSLGYVRGDLHALLIDCGNSPAHLALMLEEILRAGLPVPDMAAITHSHWDHTYGMCAFGGVTFATQDTQQALRQMSAWQWTADAMQHRLATGEDIAFCHDCIVKEYPDTTAIRVVTADAAFTGSMTLNLGGCTAALLQLDNSHASDCAVVHIPEEGVLFTGDITYMDLHHNPPCWHVHRRTMLLHMLRALPFHYAVPGHQEAKEREEFFANIEEAFQEDYRDGVLLLDD